MRTLLLFLVTLALLVLPSTTYTTIIHVPGNQPTIQDGINAADDGDTVLVAPGTYTGPGNSGISFQGKAILVTSEMGPDSTKIYYASTGFWISQNETYSSVLRGFKISRMQWGIYLEGASPIITECVLDSCVDGIIGGGGMVINAYSSPIVMNCEFVNCYQFGSTAYGTAMEISSSSPYIINCTFFNNFAFLDGVVYSSGSNPHFINCTFSQNDPRAISSPGNVSTITNCIFWDNWLDDIYGDAIVRYSDIEEGWPGPGNISEDPLFVDPENNDFRLLLESPCIDTGHPNYPNVPWGGLRRDMGAFEFDQGFYFDGQNLIKKPVPIEFPVRR
jgi:hypothetical protein